MFDQVLAIICIILVFLLAIFQIQTYDHLPADQKEDKKLGFGVAVTALVFTSLYFAYIIYEMIAIQFGAPSINAAVKGSLGKARGN
jgi:hypothetical protein